jgi:GAF domain-containing protein
MAGITAMLVDDYDVDAVLRLVTKACVDLLDVTATGVMITDPRGGVQVVAASDDRSRFVELMQAHTDEGPCVDCMRTGSIVVAADLRQEADRWPVFVPEALAVGFRAVHAIPMAMNGRTVGGLNLLHAEPRELSPSESRLAQVLADLTVLGLSQERDPRRADLLVERTLIALDHRVLLDHATGMVAGALDLDPEQARAVLREHATAVGRPMAEVARAVTTGELDLATLPTRPPATG